MFERNRVDNSEAAGAGVAVEIVTDAGETLAGRLFLAMGRGLVDALNGAGGFVEFEPWGGERAFVAKSSLKAIRPARTSRPESLKAKAASLDGFDPFATLGVAQDASYEDVKSAWHRLSKLYHPDRYAAAELPPEVIDYLSGMARRINAAYAALEKAMLAERRVLAQRSAPIYTSSARA
ncbi:MAG: J domain-containing protein [Proteobacteria bacterium]|nr:J domain-containing protein [Pseudomonadota bacterium]